MRRREFITLLGGAAAWPVVARAQQSGHAAHRCADDACRERPGSTGLRRGVPRGTAEARLDGRPQHPVDTRWATLGDAELRQRLAKELVALQPEIVLSQNTPTTAALVQQTRTIPIIFTAVSDPVGSGFVASFNRPGGNVPASPMRNPR